MEVVNRKITELKPYEKNPRKNDEAVKYVANSIREFGFKVPIIIDKNDVIVAGHTRYKASLQLGLATVPCVVADDLTDEQIRAFRLADNRSGEIATWDDELLNEELDNIFNLDMGELFGFVEKKKKNEKVVGDVPFTNILGEEHNYIVLYFDNEVDWLQAETLFELETVQCPSTRKDGEIKSNMHRLGVGRVLEGKKALDRIMGVKDEDKR